MVLQSIENKMISVINRKKNGTILFASDFADMGERKAINKAFALQILGQGRVSKEQLNRIGQLLSNEPKERIAEDLKLVPGWIRSIILKAYE